jgi:hypothetical protein
MEKGSIVWNITPCSPVKVKLYLRRYLFMTTVVKTSDPTRNPELTSNILRDQTVLENKHGREDIKTDVKETGYDCGKG